MSRRWPAPLLATYVALVVVVTLAPFDFTWSTPLDASLRGPRVEWIPFTYECPVHGRFCLHDRISNVLLFLPFGALAVLLPHRRAAWSVRMRRVAAAAFAVSVGIEAAQLLLPSRFPSTADVLLNTLGAWLGAALAAALGRARARGGPPERRAGAGVIPTEGSAQGGPPGPDRPLGRPPYHSTRRRGP